MQWHNALSLSNLKVSIILHNDDSWGVVCSQDSFQHEEVVRIRVYREQVKARRHFKPLEMIHYIIRPEYDLFQVNIWIFISPIQEERSLHIPPFFLPALSQLLFWSIQ